MGTVLSHIIQTRYSGQFENIATDALVYILNQSNNAKAGLMNLLRSISPGLPDLTFNSQWKKGETVPDIWGTVENKERVYIENKFWAGLTINQPVAYLRNLSTLEYETLLLFVVPEKREEAMKGELARRLKVAEINITERVHLPAGVAWAADTDLKTPIALTSWQRLVKILEDATGDERETLENLDQLLILCKAADNSAFIPFNDEDINNQKTPAYLIQLGQLITDSIKKAEREKIIYKGGLRDSKVFGNYGYYARLNNDKGVEFLLKLDYELWKKTGRSPLWIKFHGTKNGQASKVKPVLEGWNQNKELLLEPNKDGISVAIDILPNADKDEVQEDIVRQIKRLGELLKEIQRQD